MNLVLKENFAKNIALLVILYFTYAPIQEFLQRSPIVNDIPLAGDFLVAVSILLVTACFANFAFTYGKLDKKNPHQRWLGHATTFVLMLLLGLGLEMTSALTDFLIGTFPIFNLSLVLLYLGTVLYDFWDIERQN
jgi:hypothetical protein